MPILYEVTAKNGKKNYLFGTIHSIIKEVVTLPIEVKTAFDQADCYLFENTATGREIYISQEKLKSEWVKKATENQTGPAHDYYIKRALEYKKASILKQSGNLEYYEKNMTSLINDILTTSPISCAIALCCGQDTENKDSVHPKLDLQLMRQARNNGKPMYSLETTEEALTAFYGYRFSYQEHLEFFTCVGSYLEGGGDFLPGENILIELYLAENAESLQKMSSLLPLIHKAPAIVKKYEEDLEVERDIKMANRMKPYLETGASFTAVGAAHLVGIIADLIADGYVVTPLNLSERKYPAYEPKLNLGLFGFHPSQTQLQELDPSVKFETTEDGMVARFSNFQKFPSINTLLNFKEEDGERPPNSFKDKPVMDSLLKKYNCDIGFFNTPELSYLGDREKFNEYCITYGK